MSKYDLLMPSGNDGSKSPQEQPKVEIRPVKPNYEPGFPVPGGSTYVGKGAPPPDKKTAH